MFNQIAPSGGIIDFGGQWSGKTHYRLESLTDELGLRRRPSFHEGKGVFIWNNEKVDTSPVDFGGESVCMLIKTIKPIFLLPTNLLIYHFGGN